MFLSHLRQFTRQMEFCLEDNHCSLRFSVALSEQNRSRSQLQTATKCRRPQQLLSILRQKLKNAWPLGMLMSFVSCAALVHLRTFSSELHEEVFYFFARESSGRWSQTASEWFRERYERFLLTSSCCLQTTTTKMTWERQSMNPPTLHQKRSSIRLVSRSVTPTSQHMPNAPWDVHRRTRWWDSHVVQTSRCKLL